MGFIGYQLLFYNLPKKSIEVYHPNNIFLYCFYCVIFLISIFQICGLIHTYIHIWMRHIQILHFLLGDKLSILLFFLGQDALRLSIIFFSQNTWDEKSSIWHRPIFEPNPTGHPLTSRSTTRQPLFWNQIIWYFIHRENTFQEI